MHQLLLLRHAKSSWDSPDQPDRDRPLNARGRNAAALLRQTMRDLGLEPDVILVSTARRTCETLELLEPWDETPLREEMDSLYLAPPTVLLDALNKVADTARSVMIVGHNPGLHELALSLAAPQGQGDMHQEPLLGLTRGFPSGALAEFSVAVPWSRLTKHGGQLVRFITPRELEGTG
jgi:phosphohistidine phosphatase